MYYFSDDNDNRQEFIIVTFPLLSEYGYLFPKDIYLFNLTNTFCFNLIACSLLKFRKVKIQQLNRKLLLRIRQLR